MKGGQAPSSRCLFWRFLFGVGNLCCCQGETHSGPSMFMCTFTCMYIYYWFRYKYRFRFRYVYIYICVCIYIYISRYIYIYIINMQLAGWSAICSGYVGVPGRAYWGMMGSCRALLPIVGGWEQAPSSRRLFCTLFFAWRPCIDSVATFGMDDWDGRGSWNNWDAQMIGVVEVCWDGLDSCDAWEWWDSWMVGICRLLLLVTHNILTHNSLSLTQHCHAKLCHIQLCRTNSVTYNSVIHNIVVHNLFTKSIVTYDSFTLAHNIAAHNIATHNIAAFPDPQIVFAWQDWHWQGLAGWAGSPWSAW